MSTPLYDRLVRDLTAVQLELVELLADADFALWEAEVLR